MENYIYLLMMCMVLDLTKICNAFMMRLIKTESGIKYFAYENISIHKVFVKRYTPNWNSNLIITRNETLRKKYCFLSA